MRFKNIIVDIQYFRQTKFLWISLYVLNYYRLKKFDCLRQSLNLGYLLEIEDIVPFLWASMLLTSLLD